MSNHQSQMKTHHLWNEEIRFTFRPHLRQIKPNRLHHLRSRQMGRHRIITQRMRWKVCCGIISFRHKWQRYGKFSSRRLPLKRKSRPTPTCPPSHPTLFTLLAPMVSIRRNNGYPPFILLTPDHTTTLGKIIISEQCLPENKKTIHPTSMGGFIGGDKYLIPSGIVFKVKPRPRRSPLTRKQQGCQRE